MITYIHLPKKNRRSASPRVLFSKIKKILIRLKSSPRVGSLSLIGGILAICTITVLAAFLQKTSLPLIGGEMVITSISKKEGIPSSLIEIKGRRFGDIKGGDKNKLPGAVIFTGKDEESLSPEGREAIIVGWTDNKISFFVPPEAESGRIYVVNRQNENLRFTKGQYFSIKKPEPQLTNLSVTSSKPAEVVQINGENLGNYMTTAYKGPVFPGRIIFANEKEEFEVGVLSWTDSQIEIFAPYQLSQGDIQVQLGFNNEFVSSNKLHLKIEPPTPQITSLNRDNAKPLEEVVITGNNLGQNLHNEAGLNKFPGQVFLGQTEILVTGWNPGTITAYLPTSVPVGQYELRVSLNYLTDGRQSNSQKFSITPPAPKLLASPFSALPSEIITLSGEGFGNQLSDSRIGVLFPGRVLFSPGGSTSPSRISIAAPILSWSETSIQVNVPPGVSEGKLFVNLLAGSDNYFSDGEDFSPKIPDPQIDQLSSQKVQPGEILDIYGNNLGQQMGTEKTAISYPGQVILGGKTALPVLNGWESSHIQVFVPWGSQSGPVRVELIAGRVVKVSNEKAVAVEQTSPKVEKVTILDDELNRVTIRGTNFGNPIKNPYIGGFNPGSVFLSRVQDAKGSETQVLGASRLEAKIEAWTDDKITVRLPKNEQTGYLYVGILGSQGLLFSNGFSYPQK